MTYEINFVYELLGQVGVDTTTLPSEEIYAFLGELDSSFILDEYALYQFLDTFQIDYSEFDESIWDGIMYQTLGIIDLPFSINAASDVLSEVGADTSAWEYNQMYEYLLSVDLSDFILTETFIVNTLSEYGVVWEVDSESD